MADDIILAATIAYELEGAPQTLRVTDAQIPLDSALLASGGWEPRIDSDVSWSEQARHPYQSQMAELTIGDITLDNHDGGLDAYLAADIIGFEVDLRRGRPTDAWEDFEPVLIARTASRQIDALRVVLDLDNVLVRLRGPLSDAVFDDTVPNPELVGTDIPIVIGRVKQAPVLSWDPNTLEMYTASNVSKIGEVQEGANPTQRWALEDQPNFRLLGAPRYTITADFEGPGSVPVDLLSSIGSFENWTDGKPDGWVTKIESYFITGQSGTLTEVATGAQIESGSPSVNAVFFDGVEGKSIPQDSNQSTKWINPENLDNQFDATDYASITIDSSKVPDLIEVTFPLAEVTSGWVPELYIRSEAFSGNPEIKRIIVKRDNEIIWARDLNYIVPAGATSKSFPLFGLINYLDKYDENLTFQLEVNPLKEGEIRLYRFVVADSAFSTLTSTGVAFHKDLSLTIGKNYGVKIEYEASSDPLLIVFGTVETTTGRPSLLPVNGIFPFNLMDGDGAISFVWKAEFSIACFWVAQLLRDGDGRGPQIINRLQVIDQQETAATAYSTAIPAVLDIVGLDTAQHLDDAMIAAHETAAGNPDLGWLVRGETGDQVLFRLAGSLGGMIWHGLDGKVRSQKLAAPADPGTPVFEINDANADIADISVDDDSAPRLTKRAHALRNWQPIPLDRQAGVTTTWPEEERAAAAADWRITRKWAATEPQATDFDRRWPDVAGREPYDSALLDAADAQALADQVSLWLGKPQFFSIPVQVPLGQLDDVATGKIVHCALDFPGLQDRWLLVMGRAGSSRAGIVDLTLWG